MEPGRDYIGVGVGAIIEGPDGKLLLAERAGSARDFTGVWEFPGGTVEFGETLHRAVVREAKEEVDINIEVVQSIGIVDDITEDNRSRHWLGITFLCKYVAGVPRVVEPHKCSGVAWHSLAEVEQLKLAPYARRDLEYYKAHLETRN